MSETRDLGLILDARIPIVAIESPDERRVLGLLVRFAMERGIAFFEWSVTRGLRRGGLDPRPGDTAELTEPSDMLAHVARSPGPALYALCDLHPYLTNEPKVIRQLKDLALAFDELGNTLVLLSHEIKVPRELSRVTATVNLKLPSDEELLGIVRLQAQEWGRVNGGRKVKTDEVTLKKLVANLRGVSHADAHVLVRHAIHDGVIDTSDIPEVNRLKFDLLDAEGVLHFEYETESFAHVAGLDNLKAWLALRREALTQASGRDRPKGILLLGVQGSGKSLAAKAVAGFFGLPLLRLDFGTLYNKFFGETERNLRNSLKQAELMTPCVLWMDEIEKGIATGSSDNATSKRVLGTLLTWMSENKRPVFLVATSNDISELPPELLRKGRLDEVFFVDLPDGPTRREIFRIHLEKRSLDPALFAIDQLAARAEGFTGAEIEEAVVSARYLAASRAQSVCTEDIAASIDRTFPISVLRAESIDALRTWARGRTVPA